MASGDGHWRIRIVTSAPGATGKRPVTSVIRVPRGEMDAALRVSRWKAKTSSTGAAISTDRSKAWGRAIGRS